MTYYTLAMMDRLFFHHELVAYGMVMFMWWMRERRPC